ncbi:39S ribosomal protein L35 [Tropilaelaps mercedesae]|uniref:39S ribosomal protein L35 n=1 Tax=Tropilaelaps mercedesae TaxID=418985 RepID=A0A1V9XS46_9ACAR|nr:39S ribosomal protein L35 [Tropilaelaps mercedesae]
MQNQWIITSINIMKTPEDRPLKFCGVHRLNCGLWIHAVPGRDRKLWRKTPEQLDQLRKHVFCRRHECKVRSWHF